MNRPPEEVRSNLVATFTAAKAPPGYATRLSELGVRPTLSLVLDTITARDAARGVKSIAEIPFVATVNAANAHSTVHGGNIAWLADTATSAHLSAFIGTRNHVTSTLTVSFLRPVPIGVPCVITSRVVRVGRAVAFLEADVFSTRLEGASAVASDADRVLCATVQHTKAMLPVKPQHRL
jgi:uncharacterized protein (TIGR00369 family)